MKRRIRWAATGKYAGFAAFVLLAALLWILKPCAPLDARGHAVLAFTLVTVGAWIFHPWDVPCSVSGLFMLGAMIAVGMPSATVFSGFTQSALWTLIPALFFGLSLQKSGLGRRIAMGVFGLFPPSWPMLILAWGVIGVALSLVTPSMTVRAAIMLPIARQCCELYGLEKPSRGASLILITALMMAIVPGNGWLTGGLTGPIIQGIFDTVPGLEGTVTFASWLKASLLPVLIATVLTGALGFFFLRPKEKLPARMDREAKTRISPVEIKTAAVLVLCCILFFTADVHKLPNTAVCLLALAALFGLGVLSPADFSAGINWDLIFFVGSSLCMSRIFADAGVSAWLSDALSPLFSRLAANPLVFVPAVLSALFLWRFIDVTTLLPTMVILGPVVAALLRDNGVSPLVWATMFALASCSVFLSYTNMWAFMGKKLAGEYGWPEGHLFRYGLAYYIACLIALLCALPYWQSAGLL